MEQTPDALNRNALRRVSQAKNPTPWRAGRNSAAAEVPMKHRGRKARTAHALR